MATELHKALQSHYAGDNGLMEVETGDYRADVVRDGVIYEIQTGSLASIKEKLSRLADEHRVVLVYPVPARKLIVRLAPDSGEELSARHSPKRGALADAFDELVHVAHVLACDNVSLQIVMTRERELRCDDGRGSWRRKGVSVLGRELLEVVETHHFDQPDDFLRLLPSKLPCRFTVADLAHRARTRQWLAGKIAYVLRHVGALRQVGKQGNAFVYERVQN